MKNIVRFYLVVEIFFLFGNHIINKNRQKKTWLKIVFDDKE